MDPNLIVNNVLKDLYRARIPLALFFFVLLIRFLFVSNPLLPFSAALSPEGRDLLGTGSDAEVLAALTYIAMLVIALVVIPSWIQSDSLSDNEAFWTTRPAREKHLLASKLASVVIVFLIIPTLLDIIVGIAYGAGWNILWTIPNNLWAYSLHISIILFIASITPDLARMIIATLGFAIVVAAWIPLNWAISTELFRLHASPNWEFILKLILTLGLIGAYVVQSLFRNRWKSVKIALVALLIAPTIAIPRFSDAKKTAYENATDLEDASLEPLAFVHSQVNRERNRLRIQQRFSVNDINPNRILVGLKSHSQLTTERGGRQEHLNETAIGHWFPDPFFRLLQNEGYEFTHTSPAKSDQYIQATLLAFGEKNQLKEFFVDASLELTSWYSEYAIASIASIPLDRPATVSQNETLSSIRNLRFYNKQIEEGPHIGKQELLVKVDLQESRFANQFNTLRFDNQPELWQKNNHVRFYFLYDPLNKYLSAAYPQFDPRRAYHLDMGLPLFGPNIQKRRKWLTFEMQHDNDIAIDRKRLRLVIVDLKKTGNRALSNRMTISDLSKQIDAIRNDPQTNGSSGRWEKTIPIN